MVVAAYVCDVRVTEEGTCEVVKEGNTRDDGEMGDTEVVSEVNTRDDEETGDTEVRATP
jgi:hypothetical protein